MAEQVRAIAEASMRPNVRIGIIPWTTPVTQFPRGGFHLYDDDAVNVATDAATAIITAPADIATYVEVFTALEETACFDDTAREHLAASPPTTSSYPPGSRGTQHERHAGVSHPQRHQ
jgi:Domain of unknown function (DUF5753)